MASKGSVADAQEDSAISDMSFEVSATVPGHEVDPVQDPPPPMQQHPLSFSSVQPSEQPEVHGGYNGTRPERHVQIVPPLPSTPRTFQPPRPSMPGHPTQVSGVLDPITNPRGHEAIESLGDTQDLIRELYAENDKLNKDSRLNALAAADLRRRLSAVTAEKTEKQQQLQEMNDECERVESEKNQEIEGLKSLLKEKERYIQELKNEKADQEKNIAEAKQQYEDDVEKLKKKIDTLTNEQLKNHISYLGEIHKLEKQLKDCQTNEERLLKKIAEAEKDAQYYKAELAEKNRRQAEQKQQQAEEENKQTKEDHEQTKEELAKERRNSELKDQEIRQLQQQLKQLSPLS